ncbi:MAG TPA: hypothetical protein PL033_19595 [Candidatus Brocadiia bacterium]|nr:hypothetical protein [Candidatus Brocadiia bacterium]
MRRAKTKAAVVFFVVVLTYPGIQVVNGQATDEKKEPDKAGTANAAEAETYTYLGKPRTKKWFDAMFEEFKDKLTIIDGKVYDLGEDVALERLHRACYRHHGIGALCGGCDRPLVVQAKDSVILVADYETHIRNSVRRPSLIAGPVFEYAVEGVKDAERQVKRQFRQPMVYIGEKIHKETLGIEGSIKTYKVHTSLTREEFMSVLTGGEVLYRYRLIRTKEKGPRSANFAGYISKFAESPLYREAIAEKVE